MSYSSGARLLLGAILWLLCLHPSLAIRAESTLTRVLPSNFTPGTAVSVALEVLPGTAVEVYAVQERVPSGWTVTAVSHGGVWDSAGAMIRWGPFVETPALARTLSFRIEPDAAATEGLFVGEGRFDGIGVTTAGDASIVRFPGSLVRTLPDFYRPGQVFTVSLLATAAPDVDAYAVEQSVPEGWTVSAMDNGGVFDARNHKVKWGPFSGGPFAPKTLTFAVTPPAEARDAVALPGRAIFDAVPVVASGPAALAVEPSRILPVTDGLYRPEQAGILVLETRPAGHVRAYSVEIPLPAGWTASGITHGGQWDAATRRVKWGPFTEETPVVRSLQLSLTPHAGADGDVTLAGRGVFDTVDVGFSVLLHRFRVVETNSVVSTLPSSFVPGVPIDVSLEVSPRSGATVMSIEDLLPEGWEAVPGSLSEGGTFDAQNRKVKWGPFFGTGVVVRTLSYRALPPLDGVGTATFAGSGWFGDDSAVIQGQRVTVAPPGQIVRQLTRRYLPGVPFRSALDAIPAPTTDAYAVEEDVPVGWSFVSATEGGQFDGRLRRIKWGPFPDATRRTLTYRLVPPLDVGTNTLFEGRGFFQHTLLTTSGETQAVLNQPPTAVPFVAERIPGQPFKISTLELADLATDPDGDPLEVVAVSSVSTQGGAPLLVWPWIYFTPRSGYDGTDDFEFTLSDGFGGDSTARLEVRVMPPTPGSQNVVDLRSEGGGSRRLVFSGIPGFTYHIEVSADLFNWQRLGDRTAGPNGRFELLDTEAATVPVRYYRTVWP